MLDYASVLEGYLIDDTAIEGVGSTIASWIKVLLEAIKRLITKIRMAILSIKTDRLDYIMMSRGVADWINRINDRMTHVDWKSDPDFFQMTDKETKSAEDVFTSVRISSDDIYEWFGEGLGNLQDMEKELRHGFAAREYTAAFTGISESDYRAGMTALITAYNRFFSRVITIVNTAADTRIAYIKQHKK